MHFAVDEDYDLIGVRLIVYEINMDFEIKLLEIIFGNSREEEFKQLAFILINPIDLGPVDLENLQRVR